MKMAPCDKCHATADYRCICSSLAEGCQASSQNDRVCKNCKFWKEIPKWAIAKDQGDCQRINIHWVKHYETDDPPLVNTAILSDKDAFLVTRGAFGCNLFEEGSINDRS
jgi:hypothetical protein